LIWAKVIHLRNTKKFPSLNAKSYQVINDDLSWGCEKAYGHYTEDEVFHVKDYGKFFPEVYKNPAKYLQKLDESFIQM